MCGAIRHGIESIEGWEIDDDKTIDDVVTAKETTPKTKKRLCEEHLKQKEYLLSEKDKIEAELTEKRLFLIVSRNKEMKYFSLKKKTIWDVV